MAGELALGLLFAALVVFGLVLLLVLEPSAPRVDLPRPNPRPKLLDQPYRPTLPVAR